MAKAEIEGYICVTDRQSKPFHRKKYGYFSEVIRGKAFNESIHLYGDVPLVLNHREDRVIAKGSDLELYEDNIGLKFIAKTDDVEVIAKAMVNELKGCSFQFTPLKDSMDKKGVRTIEKLQLHHVCLLDEEPVHSSIVRLVYVPEDLKMAAMQYRVDRLKA